MPKVTYILTVNDVLEDSDSPNDETITQIIIDEMKACSFLVKATGEAIHCCLGY